MNVIYTRRSVRSYEDREVEQEKIEQILKAGMQAPSARNGQPWEFIVVTNKEALKQLSTYNPFASCLAEAPLGIVVMFNGKTACSPEHWQQDLGACTQNIMLEATSLGLGTVWFGTATNVERMDFIQKMFKLDKRMLPYSVIAVGYPKNEDANHFIDRYDPKKVHYVK